MKLAQHIVTGETWTVVQVGETITAYATTERGGRDAERVARWLALGALDPDVHPASNLHEQRGGLLI